jgi:hypothetical protein
MVGSVTRREDTSDNGPVPRRRQREREGRAARQEIAQPPTAAKPAKAARAQRRSNYAWYRRVPWVAVAALAVTAVSLILILRTLGVGGAGRYIAGSGVGQHLSQGQTTVYPSYPPTSGIHAPSPTNWGVHTEPVPDEVAVHNLEHGGVVVSHNNISADDLAKLTALLTTYPKDQYNSVKLLIRPYDKVPAGTFTLTAWNWVDEGLTAYDDARVRAFLDSHLNKCCEALP